MSGEKETLTLIPFGPFEVDVYSQELRKQGVRLRLPRQSFQILRMLLERPGELVTREEMRQALWPSDTFVDFEHGLNAAINRLRETLGEDADNPRYVETLPRRGYRLITSAVPKVATEPVAIQPKVSQPGLRKWSLALVAAGVIGIATVLLGMDVGGLRSKLLFRFTAQPQIRSLAVLPLTNLSGDPQQEYFADGMTEQLITEFSRIGSLRVISRTSVMPYKGEKKKSLSQIGLELHADAVVEGSVLRAGNRVRITVHMVYAPSDQNLVTETYEDNLEDILKLQREVAKSITEKARLKLSPQELARFQQVHQVNSEAFDSYLKAMQFNWMNVERHKQALNYFKTAIQKDPDFADAYMALGWCYIGLAETRALSPADSGPPAKEAIRKALELDKKNCNAHHVLAWIKWRYDWDWATADKEFNYALELCPNSELLHWEHSYYSAWRGHVGDALLELEKSREVDPLMSESRFLHGKMLIDYHLRDYKSMLELGPQYAALNPDARAAHLLLGYGYEVAGQTPEAIPEYQKAVVLSPDDLENSAALAHAYATTGRTSEALKILHQWERRSKTSYVSPYMIAIIYVGLGNKDKASENLEKAYQERSTDLPYFLRADFRVDNLRSDPRFQDLMRRMNFPK